MTWFDYTALAVVGLSMLFGLFRGLVRELIALAGWVAAFVLAILFADRVAARLPAAFGVLGGHIVAFVGILIAVWILAGIIGWIAARLVRAVGMGWPDRVLGALFGAVRGVLITLALVMAAGLTPVPGDPGWREALLSGPLETAVIALKPRLPAALAERIKYR